MAIPAEVEKIAHTILTLADERAPGLIQGLYLRGSLGFGEWFAGTSDVDFTAVLPDWPGPAELDALAAVHALVHDLAGGVHVDGFHVTAADLARPPADCPDAPCMFEGTFRPAARFDVNPVSWHELARHSITVRGPELSEREVWTDPAELHAFSRDNLTTYWTGKVMAALDAARPERVGPAEAAWCVLGVSRLHHLLAAGSMTGKSGAGRHALTAFGEQWHPIVTEALRAREQPAMPSAYADDPVGRGRDTAAFTQMAIDAGLACELPAGLAR